MRQKLSSDGDIAWYVQHFGKGDKERMRKSEQAVGDLKAAAMHPHRNCTECKSPSFEEMVAWFVQNTAQSHQTTVERLFKKFNVTKKEAV